MKKIIIAVLGAVSVLILAAAALCAPTFLQWKEIRENCSFEADYILEADGSTFYKAADFLGLSGGRLEGYDCGNGLWYIQIFDKNRKEPYTEVYFNSLDPSHSYVNMTMLGNTVITFIGDKIPFLQGFLKEWDMDRYLSLGQLEEITGMELPMEKILQTEKDLLPYTKFLPLVRLMPSAYQENGYRYYQFPDISKQFTLGIADWRTANRGINVLLDLEVSGTQAQAVIWLKAVPGEEKELPGAEMLLSGEEVQVLKEVCQLIGRFL